MNLWTDEKLMKEVKDGKVEMLAVLFEKYNIKLFNYFYRFLHQQAVSEDLVQEVFLRILKYRHTYDHHSKFSTWMYQIARNVNIDNLQKIKNETMKTDEDDFAVCTQTPEDACEKLEDVDLLHQALDQLTWKKREVLILSRFHSMKYSEIARLLNCSLENVKVLVYRGIKDLRNTYKILKGERI